MARLIITEGKTKGGLRVVTPKGVRIGRLPTNDLCLVDELVSRTHARVEFRDGTYYIVDLGSSNGTKVNGWKVQEYALANGDIITMGRHALLFEDEEATRLELKEGPSPVRGKGTIVKAPGGIPTPSRTGIVSSADALVKANRTLRTLYEVGKALLSESEPSSLLNLIMDLVFKELPAQRGFLMLQDPETGGLVPGVIRTKGSDSGSGITISRTITDMVVRERVSVLTADAASDPRFQEGESVFLYGIRSAMCVPLWKDETVMGVIYIDTKTDAYSFTEDDLDLMTAIANLAATGIQKARLADEARKEAELINRLARYHSPDVVEHIINEGAAEGMGSLAVAEKEVTVLFSDIQGFTGISERLAPSEVAGILCDYFTRMTDIVFRFGGTLDKYIGDSLMALFGAPLTREDDAARAVRAALEMQKEVARLMENRETHEHFSVRIGINTGTVVAGNIGSPRRMDYTVIGDAVNVAQRLESIARPGQVLIGGPTYEKVKDGFQLREIGRQKVKGKDQEVAVYEVVG